MKHEYPDFLDIQLKSFQDFFQLETTSDNRQMKVSIKFSVKIFRSLIHEIISCLEFLDYFIDPPRYSIEECIERGLDLQCSAESKIETLLYRP
jgi:DNA-directed RNA polymerase subunit beta